MTACKDSRYVLAKLDWMRAERIWPNGLRYLWTDAFGVVLLRLSTPNRASDEFLDEAEWVVAEVDRVLGRPRGIRIGEEPDRDGQYFHYLAMWLYALAVLGRHIPDYREKGVELVRQIHDAFRRPGPRRHLEDERGPERSLSGLRLRRARCLRWLCLLPAARRERALARDRRHARC